MPSRTINNLRYVYTEIGSCPSGEYPTYWQKSYGGLAGTIVTISHGGTAPRRKPSGKTIRVNTGLTVWKNEIKNPIRRIVNRGPYADVHFRISASDLDGGVVAVPSEERALWNELNIRLLNQIKSQNVNLAVSLKEFRSTANTVGDFARSVASVLTGSTMRKGLRLARHLQGALPGRTWTERLQQVSVKRDKAAVNAYLAYTYGLIPIMSDIKGSLELLSERLHSGEFRRRTRVKATRTSFASQRGASGVNTSMRLLRLALIAEYKVDANVQRLAQVGITNPAAAVWEMIPYSFVFDWIVPVGDYLSTLDALMGVSDLVIVGQKLDDLTQSTSSGYQNKETTMVRGNPTTGAPSIRLAYRPSKSLLAAFNGIMLLKQRYS